MKYGNDSKSSHACLGSLGYVAANVIASIFVIMSKGRYNNCWWCFLRWHFANVNTRTGIWASIKAPPEPQNCSFSLFSPHLTPLFFFLPLFNKLQRNNRCLNNCTKCFGLSFQIDGPVRMARYCFVNSVLFYTNCKIKSSDFQIHHY
jgi:hypothetical protein